MTYRLVVSVTVKMILQKAGGKVSFTVEKIGYSLSALLQPVAGGRAEDFHSIACRYDQTFPNNVPVH
jgi:hypothetical protein